MSLLASDFDFDLPPDRIAQHPAQPRDSARLLHVGLDLRSDLAVRDLPRLLRRGDLLIVNDTRVIPAQLTGVRDGATREATGGEARTSETQVGAQVGARIGARIGVTLDRPRADGSWHALARNARRLRVGDRLTFAAGLTASVDALAGEGSVMLRFDTDDLPAALRLAGALALPPYIDRPDGPTPSDSADYQTMFAAKDGAVAAPTAGLHFTPGLVAALAEAGIDTATVTLHVGAGTFLPLRHERVTDHRIHAERGVVPPATAAAIASARARGGRIVAVGTTSLRLLETAARDDGHVEAFDGETELFILPGHRFRVVDVLMTNFHLPRSTLFMLVCAFAGTERMRAAYAHAIAAGYRFYSYGDASLLERAA